MTTIFTWKDIAKDGPPPEYVPCLTAVHRIVLCGILSVENGRWCDFFDRNRPGTRQDITHWYPVGNLSRDTQ